MVQQLPQDYETNKAKKKVNFDVEANFGHLKQETKNMVKSTPNNHLKQREYRGHRDQHIT